MRALADDDLACANDLAAETLDAEALSVGVATVTSGRCAFLCAIFSPYYYLMPVILTRVVERWP